MRVGEAGREGGKRGGGGKACERGRVGVAWGWREEG